MMRHLYCLLLFVMCLGAVDMSGGETDTLIINNGARRIFGLLHRLESEGGKPKPIAVIAHGFNGDHKYGRNYFEPLERAGYQCFTFDFPCGSTHSTIDSNTVNMSIRDEQSDLMAVVDYLASRRDVDSSRIVLIGESQGGLVAALAASAIPERVHKLVLCFAAFGIPDNYNGRFKSVEEIPDTTYVWKVPLGKRFFTELRDMDAYADMKRFTRPVLLLHGDKDPVVPLSGSEKALEFYPDARLKVIKGAGHGFKADDFKLSTGYISEFLKED